MVDTISEVNNVIQVLYLMIDFKYAVNYFLSNTYVKYSQHNQLILTETFL